MFSELIQFYVYFIKVINDIYFLGNKAFQQLNFPFQVR